MNNIKEKIKELNNYKFEVEHYLNGKTLKIKYPRYFFDISENDLKFVYYYFYQIGWDVADKLKKFIQLNATHVPIPIYLFDYITSFVASSRQTKAEKYKLRQRKLKIKQKMKMKCLTLLLIK